MISNMRTIVDIPDDAIEALDQVGVKENRSRAALIRDAVDSYLKEHCVKESAEAYGIWKDDITDGVEYQQNIRKEWDDR